MQPGDTIHPEGTNNHKPEVVEKQATAAPADHKVQKPNKRQSDEGVSWEASEYIDHEKNAGWYMAMAGISVVVIAAVFLLTHDVFVMAIIIFAVVLFAVTAARKPRVLRYEVGRNGIIIDTKQYVYAEFKTFSVVSDTALRSIQLLPLKRFMPPLSIYYPPDQEDEIVNVLGMFLPYADAKNDPFDRLMARIRF